MRFGPARSRRAGPKFPDRPISSPAKADLRPVLEPGVTGTSVQSGSSNQRVRHLDQPFHVQIIPPDPYDVSAVNKEREDPGWKPY